jgi:hypothetical protein
MKDVAVSIENVRRTWDAILKEELWRCAAPLFPLTGINVCLSCYGFSSPPLASFKEEDWGSIPHVEPSFKNLTDSILLSLRGGLYSGRDLDRVTLWGEKLLRFCEVRLPSLQERSLQKWGNKNAAQVGMLHLCVFLLDYGVFFRDVRFLNTVLKLSDLKWIIRRETIERQLCQGAGDRVAALLGFRILLMTEYLFDRVAKGETHV